ncbi:ATPase [Paenibacillus sp. GCM10023248]|uniref:ATPase n=1 Tax=Bacillales TaxID=1385 RepID=UPI0023796B90|nr:MULTISPECIES: ATPase [Bacillales]MDD9272261.1 ATPase [Paenibacillus sp. MAHUQ-63]MDR6885386.1 formiminotetrahydrofolate cyclodeaminase [Bacillus sp. 3255]
MLRLGERVIVIGDSLEQNLPIGGYGYIIAYDRNNDNIFDYVIRVPKDNKHYYVPASDIELETVILSQEAEQIEKEALIDFALATKNEELFRRVMNGEPLPDKERDKEVQSREDFIKQIGLKAWI